jgi:hypothetical protein
MSAEYRRNHYVPVWYQKRFIPSEARDKKLFYLDLKPEKFTDARGVPHLRRSVRRWGPKHCFVEHDLYTVNLGHIESTQIERLFFGAIDLDGRDGVNHFENFRHGESGHHEAFNSIIVYI